jgi:hypothetical protein
LHRPCPVLHACTLQLRSVIQTIHQTTCKQKHIESQYSFSKLNQKKTTLEKLKESDGRKTTQLEAEMSGHVKSRSIFTFISFDLVENGGVRRKAGEKLGVEIRFSRLLQFNPPQVLNSILNAIILSVPFRIERRKRQIVIVIYKLIQKYNFFPFIIL